MLVIAAKVHHSLGDERRAGELLLMAKQKNSDIQGISEQVMNEESIFSGGERLGLNHEHAVAINDTGTQLFIDGLYAQAMKHFYDAFQLSPATAAFGLNLLQCMIEADTAVYRRFNIHQLLDTLSELALSESNTARLAQLTLSVRANS